MGQWGQRPCRLFLPWNAVCCEITSSSCNRKSQEKGRSGFWFVMFRTGQKGQNTDKYPAVIGKGKEDCPSQFLLSSTEMEGPLEDDSSDLSYGQAWALIWVPERLTPIGCSQTSWTPCHLPTSGFWVGGQWTRRDQEVGLDCDWSLWHYFGSTSLQEEDQRLQL